MTIRAVFLDFGGTLVHSQPEPFEAMRPVLDSFGLGISIDRYADANHRVLPRLRSQQYTSLGQLPSFWDRVHAAALEELGVVGRDDVVRAIRAAVTSPEWHRPYPETEAVLRELRRRGLGLHVVSNNTDYLVEAVHRLGWDQRFDSLTYSQEAGAEKPDRRVFELALRRAGCTPAEGLYVGDSWEADYLGACRAGLRGVWLNRDGRPLPGPAETATTLEGVVALARTPA